MSFPWRWLWPIALTGVTLAAAARRSVYPQVLGWLTYSALALALILALLSAAAWWIACDAERYRRLAGRARTRPWLSAAVFLLGALVLLDALTPWVEQTRVALLWRPWLGPLVLLAGGAVVWFTPARRGVRRVAVLCFSLATALVIAEVCFRSFFLEPFVPRTQAQFRRAIAGHWPREPTVPRPAGTVRVVGLADSFGRAGGAAHNYHYVLEAMLNRGASRPVEVVNLSRLGYEPPEELELLERFGPRYEPDVVMHALFVGNDFEIYEGRRGVIYVPIKLDLFRDWSWWRPRQFLLTDWLRRWWATCVDRALRDQEAGAGGEVGTLSRARYLAIAQRRMAICLPDEDWRRKSQRMEQVLDRIVAATRSMGAEYVMVIHPDESQVDAGLWEQVVRAGNLEAERYDLDQPQRFLRDFCRRRGIACLDLKPTIASHVADGQAVYLLHDSHYNELGNRLAAQAIGDFLLEQDWLDWPRP